MRQSPTYVDDKGGVTTYSYFEKSMNFPNAQVVCQGLSSHLAYIETVEAKDRIFSYLRTQNLSYWWIGLKNRNNSWEWINGEKLDSAVIDFAEKDAGKGCGRLYQPARGHDAGMYDYTCDKHKSYYICESHSESFNISYQSQWLGGGAIAAIALGILLLTVIAILFIIGRKRQNNREKELRPFTNEQPQPEKMDKKRQFSKRQNAEGDYATIDDDVGYATIDTVVYSEVIDDAFFSEESVRGTGAVANSPPSTEETYATVNKERKSSKAKPPELYTGWKDPD